jgi:nitronate monooxygenase
MIHIHKCTSLRHALHAQADGVDMVTVVGYEADGHPSPYEIGSFVLFNGAAAVLSIPVLAGGGITDGRGLAAALALGCEGVVVGTRFVASEECWIHHNFKKVIVDADEKATLTCQRNINNLCRYYNNAQARKAVEVESTGGGLEEMLAVVSGALGYQCYQSGDTEGSCFSIGVGAALIQDVKPAATIIEEMVAQAQAACMRLQTIYQTDGVPQ